jgi:hypothetical protein
MRKRKKKGGRCRMGNKSKGGKKDNKKKGKNQEPTVTGKSKDKKKK